LGVKRRIEISPDAVRQFRALRAHDRALVKEQIREQLGESEATQPTRNRFRLRRPSRFADYELRIRDWRVFYRVVENTVRVVLIGRKRGNYLVIDRKRFIL
jgi:mRNA-degrading endonuclease RelE of RelBE toxin-antitoxin system